MTVITVAKDTLRPAIHMLTSIDVLDVVHTRHIRIHHHGPILGGRPCRIRHKPLVACCGPRCNTPQGIQVLNRLGDNGLSFCL